MWRPLSSLLLLLVEVAAALAAPTPAPAQAGAADGLSPGYFVEDEMGKCLDGSPPGESWGVIGLDVGYESIDRLD